MDTKSGPTARGRLVQLVGRVLRSIPSIPGKRTIARKVIAPHFRGHGHEVIVDLKAAGGGRLICALDDWIPWNIYIHGRYERERHCERAMIQLLTSGGTVFDIGANIGYYTVQFGRVAGPEGQVHAFEPVRSTCSILQRNVAINDLGNVHVNRRIVSSDNQARRIHISEDATGNCSVEFEQTESECVPSISMDEYCNRLGIEHVDLIKIDVEGHELEVLKGMSGLLTTGRVDHLFLEMNSDALSHANTSNAELVAFLQSFGYQASSIFTGKTGPYSSENDESLVQFTRTDSAVNTRAA